MLLSLGPLVPGPREHLHYGNKSNKINKTTLTLWPGSNNQWGPGLSGEYKLTDSPGPATPSSVTCKLVSGHVSQVGSGGACVRAAC